MSATWNQFSLIRAVSKEQLTGTACATRLVEFVMLMLLILPAVAQAQFNFTTNNGAITITGYTGPGGAVDIPDTINGLPVTQIGQGAFSNNRSLTSVTISSGVTNINSIAFRSCSNLTSVMIPNSVTFIGLQAFGGCTSLTTVTIPNGVIILDNSAFIGCTGLTNVTIPSSVTSIGNSAFHLCSRLNAITVDPLNSIFSSVDGVLFDKSQTWLIRFPGGKAGSYVVPSSVSNIWMQAFAYCSSLTSVIIPNSVTRIWGEAFEYCPSLASVAIGSGVTNIGAYAFLNCTNLSAITVDGLNSSYSSVDGVLFNKTQALLIQFPGGKAGGYPMPNGVVSIGDDAFADCRRLTSVRIPSSVTNIGAYAFLSCTGLTGVYCLGNAPSFGLNALGLANNATVYYLPGTTGWGPTFADRPAVLWNPQVSTSHASFGVRTNRFGFTITGASNLVLVVEASTNVATPDWIPVGTNILTGGASYFSDPQWTNHPARFYRLRSH